MKIPAQHFFLRRNSGVLSVDLVVALGILTFAIIPVAVSFTHEAKMLHGEYDRAVAIEIVDGEMEILAAGDWKNFPDGTQNYAVHEKAAANLPPGNFELTKNGNHLRLEWKPNRQIGIGSVMREVSVK